MRREAREDCGGKDLLMRKTAVMRRIASALTVGALAAGLASCTIGDTDGGEALESAAHTEEQETEKLPEPPEFSFTDGDEDVAPGDPVTVSSEAGLKSVVMTNEEGKTIKAAMNDEKTEWHTTEPLGYGRIYTVVATDTAGQEKTKTFTTVVPAAQTNVYMGPLDGATVGVGQAITFQFDVPIQDTKAVEELIDVETSNDTEGGFFWLDATELRWRPKEMWEPGTEVTVSANVYGKDMGGGIYGVEDVQHSFTVGDKVEAVVDNNDKMLRFYRNDALEKEFPISLGTDGSFDTPNGTYVVGDMHESLVMDSRTFGLGLGQGGYVTPVSYATQLSYSGIYLHGAPWAVWALGNTNQSHGCINATIADAQWFQQNVKRGDVVTVTNAGGGTLNGADGLGYWNMDWETRSGGSADPNA